MTKKRWFATRKFWLAAGTVIGIIASDAYGIELDPEQIASIAAIIVAWILRQGATDAKNGG